MYTEPLSLYLHIPFCDHRCAYCDFNAYAGLDSLIPRYTEALIAEIDAWAARLGGRPVPTVFFGGGTPSLLPLPLMERVLAAIRAGFAVLPDAEWSLEANPGTVDEAYLRGLRDLGLNRLSIGVQSFDDAELRRLDRIHDGATAVAAYQAARAAGFDNISLDLIFGLEGQELAGWRRNVERALALGPEHLSLYALTIEEGTPLAARVQKGAAPEPDGDLQADMYELAEDALAAAGYGQYEISNWARPGRSCRHNLVYWRNGDWLGLGAGAHSHLGGDRFAVVNSPAVYVRRAMERSGERGAGSGWDGPQATGDGQLATGDGQLATGDAPPATGNRQRPAVGAGPRACPPGDGQPATGEAAAARLPNASEIAPFPWIASTERADRATAIADHATLALRLNEGLSLTEFARRFGTPFEELYGAMLAEMTGAGLLHREGDRLVLTRRGRLLSNEVFVRLLD